MTSKDIREQFISFFVGKGHVAVPSAAVIPQDDPTLLFTNAGMNQFKPIFLGMKDAIEKRVVDSQKCIRAGGKHNDLEEVGKDGYHHTFFEMLGNWSFGDYYKKEAIMWAWELLTEVWKLPKDKLHATVYQTDQEAFELWQQHTDITPSHITYHGDKDNFWEMGETGPCGPCSEIHIDRGPEGCDKQGVEGHICKVNGDCARYIELWNLVFIQYNRDEEGNLNPLPQKYVDTGAGLERICQILQNQTSNYHTDLFMPILNRIAELSGIAYTEECGMPHRVVADHIRCLCFALADGGFPGNEGRGYVLRRILRRAARHGRLLNIHEPFLYKLVDTVIEIMGHHYHELIEKEAYIKSVIKAEEERFNQTLDTGLSIFAEMAGALTDKVLPGKDVFMLYDTYGFPLDLTMLLAEEQGLSVDTAGFESEMQKQKARAREASQFKANAQNMVWTELREEKSSEFVGYTETTAITYITRYSLNDDGTLCFMLSKTPFYAESGGQVGDTGSVINEHMHIDVLDVRKVNDEIIHYGSLTSGMIDGSEVTAEVNMGNRKRISRNHTATHLLHKALRIVLGEHVQQKGSLVCSDYLRFDFAHFSALTPAQIRDVERLVMEQIRDNHQVEVREMSLEHARNEGATALFGEKYGEQVRMVSISGFSKELCGGIHVQFTGEISVFKIVSESSSAAGIRRIEAITGDVAEDWLYSLQDKLSQAASLLNTPEKKLIEKLEQQHHYIAEVEKELAELKKGQLGSVVTSLLSRTVDKGNFLQILEKVHVESTDDLRSLGDELKARLNRTVAVLFAVIEDKISILVVVSPDLQAVFHAGKLAGQIAALVGGKGGGRPDTAMAGGKDIEALPQAMLETCNLLSHR